MKVYVYCAALYCESCGEALCGALPFPQNADRSNPITWSSGDYPKGPSVPDPSEYPEYCDDCGVFLENSLTSEGTQEMHVRIREAICEERVPNFLLTWVTFYKVTLENLLASIQLERDTIADGPDLVEALTASTLPPTLPDPTAQGDA